MDKKLKILQIATPVLPISPSMKYGGVERVVRDLDIEYVRRGHDSLVISSKNSLVAGRLIPSLLENTWQHSKGSVEYETDPAKVKQSFENH